MPNRVPSHDVLLSTVGTPEQAELLDSSPRSRVWRVRLADSRVVIVKQVTGTGDTSADADTRFAREVAGLHLAGRGPGPSVAPTLLATDPSARVMVLEHLDDLGRTADWMPGYAESAPEPQPRHQPQSRSRSRSSRFWLSGPVRAARPQRPVASRIELGELAVDLDVDRADEVGGKPEYAGNVP
ncbi:hypothetical protein ABZ866_02175 [Streptomyces erythrochromogenes]